MFSVFASAFQCGELCNKFKHDSENESLPRMNIALHVMWLTISLLPLYNISINSCLIQAKKYISTAHSKHSFGFRIGYGFFYPSALRPKGYCRCLRPSVCLSVPPSVCLSVRPYDHACPRDNLKNIFQIFLKLGWNILWVNISDKFDDGYRSSLNMHIIDQKVTLTYFEFLKPFFKVEPSNLVQLGLLLGYLT